MALAVLHEMFVPPSVSLAVSGLTTTPRDDESLVFPKGVINGATGLFPDDAVRLGVAKAGEDTSTPADIRTSTTSMPLLHAFIVSTNPFARRRERRRGARVWV